MTETEYQDDMDDGGRSRVQQIQSPVHAYGSAIITLTDTKEVLQMAELTFKSQRPDENGNVISMGKPLMNDEGITSVLGLIHSLLNQVTVMSNINKQQVEAILMNFSDTLITDLMINRIQYAIESKSARNKILTISSNIVQMAVLRGYEEGDKRFLKGNVQEIHSTVTQSQKSRGVLSRLNPWS